MDVKDLALITADIGETTMMFGGDSDQRYLTVVDVLESCHEAGHSVTEKELDKLVKELGGERMGTIWVNDLGRALLSRVGLARRRPTQDYYVVPRSVDDRLRPGPGGDSRRYAGSARWAQERRRPTREWHAWRSGTVRPRFEVCDEDGNVIASFSGRHLDGRQVEATDQDDRTLVLQIDELDNLTVRARGRRQLLALIRGDTAVLEDRQLAFEASRDRTCRAQLRDPAGDVIFYAGPVRSRSYRPFLRLEIDVDLDDPIAAALLLTYFLARDDAGRMPLPTDDGTPGI